MTQITYDPEVQILKIRFSKNQSTESDIIDNLVLDYDKNGKLVNIDVMDVKLEELLKASKKHTTKI